MDPSPSPSPAPAASRGASDANLRWGILRRALLTRSSSYSAPEGTSNEQQNKYDSNVSRKASRGFNLLEYQSLPISQLTNSLGNSVHEDDLECQKDVCACYKLPGGGSSKLNLVFRREDSLELNDIEASNRYNIDTTGLVCCWPSEEVLAYYCINHSDNFRCVMAVPSAESSRTVRGLGKGFSGRPYPRLCNAGRPRLEPGTCWLQAGFNSFGFGNEIGCSGWSKKVLELGSGYGLAGLVIAASTSADEVVISDGNPQVVGYIQKNIDINAETFGETKVKSMMLHWDKEQPSEMFNAFDIIVASDCTFFKQFHQSLARVIKSLLKHSATSQAIFLSPKRGDSLDKFLEIITENGLCFELIENYDPTVWNLHKKYTADDDRAWPNYDEEHCYPLLVTIKFFSE
ncbi:hypothetical protein PR202_gb19211 [Eleusine coracana subsp. coracana]|uniref:Calmodulin-lysine N-methyltransferase n=1 Tax=Eleusine coracana subsp. coracana TaxID=191504 RepID=A0AAV5F996_ELECO|nr:hypothetical protein PR202_gb19211 [Eleusine coracana subsp. coracana]